MSVAPMRWARIKREGRSAYHMVESYELKRSGERLATVASNGKGGWYWYGLGQNTSHSPKADLGEAKAEAIAFARATSS